MIALAGKFLQGILIGGKILDLGFHICDFALQAFDFRLLILYFYCGTSPVKYMMS